MWKLTFTDLEEQQEQERKANVLLFIRRKTTISFSKLRLKQELHLRKLELLNQKTLFERQEKESLKLWTK